MTNTTRELTWNEKMRLELAERVKRMGGFDEALKTRIVEAKIIESQYEAFELGKRIERLRGDSYYIEKKSLQEELSKALGSFGRNLGTLTLPVHGGQSGGGGDNVLVVVQPYWGDKGGKHVTIELGCAHSIVATKKGRCWYSYKCSKCGWWYEVDSSD
jgi:hypothetical protein